MKTILFAAVAAVTLSSAPAFADFLDAKYQATTTGGAPVTGEFIFDTSSGTLRSSTLDGNSAPIVTQQSGVSLDLSTAQFQVGTFFTVPGTLNDSITVTLNALTNFAPGSTLASILETQIGNVDLSGANSGTGSEALFRDTDASGAGPVEDSFLTSISVTVPEPASLALLGVGLVGLIAASRRRA